MAGVEVGTGYVSVVPSAKGFQAALRKEIGNAGTIVGRQLGSDAGNAFTDAMGSAARSVGQIAARAATVVAAAGAGLAAWGLKSAADLQQVEIAFEGILGSGEKANAFLGELRKFAATTPFEFPELATASKQLLAVGFQAGEVLPIMTKLGNVAAVLGVGGDAINGVVRALGQMQGKGKASAEELQQISEAIPGFSAIKAIAEGMGKSVAEVSDLMASPGGLLNVGVGAGEAIQFILQGMERFPGAAGAMARQSQTLNGVLSTLKDTARDALVAGIAPILPSLSTSLQAAAPAISGVLTVIGSLAGNLVNGLSTFLIPLLPLFDKLVKVVGPVLEQVFVALADVVGASVGPLGDFFAALMPLVGALAKALGPALVAILPSLIEIATTFATALTPVVVALTPTIVLLAQAFADVVAWIGPAGVGALLAAKGLLAVKGIVVGLLPAVTKLWALIAAHPFVAIGAAIVLAAILIIQHWDAVKSFLSDVWEWIKGATGAVVGWFKDHWTDVIGTLLVGPIWLFRDTILDVFGKVVSWFSELPGKIIGAIGDFGSMIANAIADGFKGAWNTIADLLNDAIPDKIAIPFFPDIDLPDNPIPKLHSGGIFRAPFGASEGLALLKNNERVLPAGATSTPWLDDTGAGTGGMHFHGPVTIGDRDVLPDLDYWAQTRMAPA